MPSELTVETRLVDNDILAIILHGSLETATTDQFNRAVEAHLAKGLTKFIIDCRYVGYVSSAGIGSLVALQTRLRKRGGEVKLAAVQGMVVDLMRLVRLDKLLNIYGDLEFARQAFAQGHSPG
ncbi:MAG TPA: STAS domain-containing protein [Gemmataceae bacterium]|jgi:anti-sigma B factor antagonist|nr:STAS domain-containing protein [Gemmataceae bacterium]